MATVYAGINLGSTEQAGGVLIQTSGTTGKDVEVVINLANVPLRNQALLLMDEIEKALLKNNWQP